MIEINLFDKSIYENPFDAFCLWRNSSPVVHDPAHNTYAITKFNDVISAFRDAETFTSSLGARANSIPQPFMIDADDPEHRNQRRIVERAFTPGQMAFYEDGIRKMVINKIEQFPRGEVFDIVKFLTHPLPVMTVGKILGVPESDFSMLQKWGESMVEGADGWENVTTDVVDAVISWFTYFDEYAKYKRSRSDGDLISILLRAHYEEGLITYEQARGNALALLVGGNETARYFLTSSLFQIIKRKDIYNSEYISTNLNKIINESVRYSSPAVSSIRHTTRDVNVSGFTIPQKSQVMLMILSANMDEEIYSEPMEFNPNRDSVNHVGFGFGIHYCLGSNLAKIQLKVVMEELIKRIPDAVIPDGFHPDMKFSTFLRGPKNLEVFI